MYFGHRKWFIYKNFFFFDDILVWKRQKGDFLKICEGFKIFSDFTSDLVLRF